MMFLLLLGCGTTHWCEASGTAMHTTWSAEWPASDCALEDRLQDRMEAIDRQVSVWDSDSELVALHLAVDEVVVSETLANLVQDTLDLAANTNGAFDPTIEPLMIAWGLHGDAGVKEPTPEELELAMRQVGYRRVDVRHEATGARVHSHGRQLDLSSVLEGHAADELSRLLSNAGHGSHRVDVGGEHRAHGTGPHGVWRIGVGDGMGFPLVNRGLSASSGGEILDPRTGGRAQTDVRRVVVVASTARQADGLTTAVKVLGREAGLSLVERTPGAEGWVRDTSGVTHQTSGMPPAL